MLYVPVIKLKNVGFEFVSYERDDFDPVAEAFPLIMVRPPMYVFPPVPITVLVNLTIFPNRLALI